jgi:CRISPR-associated endoribonuclease Cas6
MTLTEIKVDVTLRKDITFKESYNVLSKFINYALLLDKKLSSLHMEWNTFKHYTFNNLYPIEKGKVYRKGKRYSFILRSLDKDFIRRLTISLYKCVGNYYIAIDGIQKNTRNKFFIRELITVTPTITTIRGKEYWTLQRDGDIMQLQEQLHNNLEKKYQSFYNEPIKGVQNFIQLLTIENRYPASIDTFRGNKEIRFLGNKFRIVPHEDEISQKLAFTALGCGLGEKNSFGGGFCVWNELQQAI